MKWLTNKIKGDITIWWVVIILSLFSVLVIYSSTKALADKFQGGNTEYYLLKHGLLLLVGLAIIFVTHRLNYIYFSKISILLLGVSVILLLMTFIWGEERNDAVRWLTLPGIGLSFQPSDIAKLALIMFLSRMLAKKQEVIKDFRKGFAPLMGVILFVCALIAPSDLSTAALLFGTSLLLLFIGRADLKHLALTLVTGALLLSMFIGAAYALGFQSRVTTWKNRLVNYIEDDKGSHQNQQAKIAIALGEVFGSGPGYSRQRSFLPNPYADFVFAILIEEYGLLGGISIIFLYLLLIYRSIRILLRSPNSFGALLAVGLAISLTIQALINMGVAVHLFPVTGLTLPLISMGGTSLLFTSLAIGIILSVSKEIEENEMAVT